MNHPITFQQLTKNWGIPVYDNRPRALSFYAAQFVAAGYELAETYRRNGRVSLIFKDGERTTLLEANFNKPYGHINPNIAS